MRIKQPLKHEPQAIGFFDGPLVGFLVEKNVIMTTHSRTLTLRVKATSLSDTRNGCICWLPQRW